ncbi:hypothetical protein E2K93_12550 [Thalassotalea sp. HSM 43]|uniref:hypothetical protein n=1 Tax=Thalassotalea sp. HSM 43 TaxID=2552945 RepID=UPI00107FDCD9|nr:hypothetical protein [Thalassotalea sp. HSM 43]QBY05161.1 hypothetical protein E2K93_12550 [Thalassotalea sp. HSM 43]
MKLNETHFYYILMFGSMVGFIASLQLGWYLSETNDWFFTVWDESTFNRIFLAAITTFIPLYFAYNFYSYYWGAKKRIRTFKERELVSLSNCKSGEIVRIQNKLIPLSDDLTSPITNRSCSAYIVTAKQEVERVSHNGNNVTTNTGWETIKTVNKGVNFMIECGEHFAYISYENANVSIHNDHHYEKLSCQSFNPKDKEMAINTLKEMDVLHHSFINYHEAIRFDEGVLEQGEQVAVVGAGNWKNTDDIADFPSNLEHIKKVFFITATESKPVYISDSKDILEKQY